eukprot:Sdes_comp21244_c0_seq1m19896
MSMKIFLLCLVVVFCLASFAAADPLDEFYFFEMDDAVGSGSGSGSGTSTHPTDSTAIPTSGATSSGGVSSGAVFSDASSLQTSAVGAVLGAVLSVAAFVL